MRLRVLLITSLPVLATIVVASALGGGQSELSSVRQATDRYHDIQTAIDAGYVTELPQTAAYPGGTCVSNGTEGAMGIHMLDTRPNGRLDSTLDPANPEALLYERRNDGSLKLTGVEYIVAQSVPRPQLYGQRFDDTNLARFGDPNTNVWTLHAWIWKPNPDGMFDLWNTRVSCDS
jgi:hypothetical protein